MHVSLLYMLSIYLTLSACRDIQAPKYSASHLQRILDSAEPGDDIFLNGRTYYGSFMFQRSGNSTHYITLSTRELSHDKTVIHGPGHGMGLFIIGSYWLVRNLKIVNFTRGVLTEGRYNHIHNVTVSNVYEGVFIKGFRNVLLNSTMHGDNYGLVLAEDKTRVQGNQISGGSGSIYAAKNSSCAYIANNNVTGKVTLDGPKHRYEELSHDKEDDFSEAEQ